MNDTEDLESKVVMLQNQRNSMEAKLIIMQDQNRKLHETLRENRKLRETLRDKFFCAALSGIFASESDEVYTHTEVVEIAWEIANKAIETRGI